MDHASRGPAGELGRTIGGPRRQRRGRHLRRLDQPAGSGVRADRRRGATGYRSGPGTDRGGLDRALRHVASTLSYGLDVGVGWALGTACWPWIVISPEIR